MALTAEPTTRRSPGRAPSIRTRCAPTSRSSPRRSTATRWSTSTRRRRARSRRSSSTPSPTTTASTTPTSIAASTRSARRRPPRTRRPGSRSRGSSTRPTATRSSSPATRPRRSTSSPTRGAGGTSTAATSIVLTEMEHHANLVPWQLLVQETDGDLEFIPITDDGILRLDVFEVLLRLKPKLVAFTHVSNTLGTINPVRDMVELAHEAGALVLIDGAQAVPHVPVDVQALGADFYVFSGHKMLGPMGSGALWARRELLEAMPPFLSGGEMIREVHLRRSDFNDIPWKFEAGTPAVGDAIGLGVAVDYLTAHRHGRRPRARERPRRVRARDAHRATSPTSPSTARWIRHCAAASSRSTCRASTRTTSPRSSTASGSPSGPATTARCRSTSGWTSRPRRAPLQRLLDPRGHRRPRRRPQGSPARLQRLTAG